MLVGFWYDAFEACADMETQQTAKGKRSLKLRIARYPDNESWLEQEVLLTQIFSVMADEIRQRIHG